MDARVRVDFVSAKAELDKLDAVKPRKNTIVVCISNQVVNELGTGGGEGCEAGKPARSQADVSVSRCR